MRIALLTTSEAAGALGKSESSLTQDRWLERGLPYIRLTRQILYDLADVEDARTRAKKRRRAKSGKKTRWKGKRRRKRWATADKRRGDPAGTRA